MSSYFPNGVGYTNVEGKIERLRMLSSPKVAKGNYKWTFTKEGWKIGELEFMVDKTALVTGACGFSGSHVCHFLLEKGWNVKAMDLGSAPKSYLADIEGKIKFVAADLTNKETLPAAVEGANVIFHPAALFNYSASMELLRAINVEGTKNLIEICIGSSSFEKMVMWSSVALYGEANPKFYKLPIREEAELNPTAGGRYDLSKREQEALARKFATENGFKVSYIRLAPIYGPGSYYGIYALWKLCKLGVLPIVFSNLHNSSIPLVHVADVSNAALFLADPAKGQNEAFNVVDDNVLDLVDTLRYFSELVDHKMKVLHPMPLKIFKPFLKLFGLWSYWEAQHLRKSYINGKKPVPKVETDTLEYLFGNFWFANDKIKQLGYQFLYPDRRLGLIETILWYNQHGWLPPIEQATIDSRKGKKVGEKAGEKAGGRHA
jgi:dihydroflavonol-4-reductase